MQDPRKSSSATRIAVIVGSTRPTRICPGIAEWVQRVLSEQGAERDAGQAQGAAEQGAEPAQGAEHRALRYELVDLAAIDLPFLDEPLKAALHDYKHEHTKRWSRLIDGYSGFVFVFPQYNWGYPAPLKNALDYLYEEWHDKPATSVTYGTRGGGKSADQMHQVFAGVHMRTLEDRIEVIITDNDVDDQWQLKDRDALMASYRDQVRRLHAQMLAALRPASG